MKWEKDRLYDRDVILEECFLYSSEANGGSFNFRWMHNAVDQKK
jgi:hypothetical protein